VLLLLLDGKYSIIMTKTVRFPCKAPPCRNYCYNRCMTTQAIFKVPPLKERKRIPMRVIRALVSQIANKFSPDEIILFGSYAYGKPTPWSDVDLLVVMETPKGELETTLEIVESLPPTLFSLDILARNRQTIDHRKAIGDTFMREITSKGKMLYARDH